MKHLLGLIFLVSISCSSINDSYESEIIEWRKERIDNLTAPISWSSLIGLNWLSEGENSFGSAKAANIKLPKGAPESVGNFIYKADSILLNPEQAIVIKNGDMIINSERIYTDAEEGNQTLNLNQYYFTAIKRNEKVGIRVWDTLHHARTLYKQLDYFPIDPKMNVAAKFIAYPEIKEITFKNVLGMDVNEEIEGYLEFDIQGQKYSIDPLDGGPEDFFLIFADETTGGETYGGGRYLYCSRPDEEGNTMIDFNKAYTPPCGFTEYATCWLPTKANTLAIEIKAGETYDGSH